MVQVNKEWCIACGLCFTSHADFFAFGADGKAEAIKQPVTDEEIASVQEAIDNCPVGAITDTKEVAISDTKEAAITGTKEVSIAPEAEPMAEAA